MGEKMQFQGYNGQDLEHDYLPSDKKPSLDLQALSCMPAYPEFNYDFSIRWSPQSWKIVILQ